MNRRQFLKRLAALSGTTLTAGLTACNRQRRPDDPPVDDGADNGGDAAPEADLSTTVAVVATADRSAGTHRAIELLEPDFGNSSVVIKPNFNSADPPPGSTHNSVLEALVRHTHSAGAQAIAVGDRSGMGETREVMRHKQLFTMADELDFEALVFDELERHQWKLFDDPDDHWQQGFALPRPVLDADSYVQTCCLKTHRFGGDFTMALKNNIGLVAKQLPDQSYDYMSELHDSPDQRLMIADVNDAVDHDLIVLDAVQGFYEEGPDTGPTASFNTIIAGTDPVAIDALGVALLRRHGTTDAVEEGPIAELDQIRRATELDIGTADPDDIEFLTDDTDSEQLVDELAGYLRG